MEDLTQENPDIVGQEAILADDAVPLCPNCLEPCDPLNNYCSNCGSNEAINPLASYMPFVDIRFKVGMIIKLWQKTWSSDTSIGYCIFYVCLILLFAPIFLFIVLPITIYKRIKKPVALDSRQE